MSLIPSYIDEAPCSQYKASCSTDKDCCSITNGKSYCNLKTNRCGAWRYCNNSSVVECPFSDLSVTEIEDVIQIIKKSQKFSSEIQFTIVRQQVPDKSLWNSGDKASRQRIAYAAVYDLRKNYLLQVLVSLSSKSVVSVKKSKDSIPPLTKYEITTGEEILSKDSRIKEAYERRGLNATYAAFIMWAFGAQEEGNAIGRRRVRPIAYYKDPETKYPFWRPVEGLSTTIDIADKKIIDFVDKGNVPVPDTPYIPESTSLNDTESTKTNIEIDGFLVKWHNWKFQYSMDPSYGLQLYHIRYIADCEERFLIYKISISEMYVPYGADGKTWRWRGAFDAGEYGLGRVITPLLLGKDVPTNAKLFPCPQVDDVTGDVDFVNDPKGPRNPDGGAFSLHRTVIHNETFLDNSAKNARFWSVINTQSRNKFNSPRGYSIHPSNLGYTFLKPGNPLNQAMFVAHPIWVTVYNEDEQGAAGKFPRSAKSGQGLPEYIKNRESLDNADLVVWHTFVYTHAPRPEEYPIMNKMSCGFHILSRNFQSANPIIKMCENRNSA
ncbi:Primary amine oxidase [Pseudolycoriella hygida]|uniref:Amine oxidase n=1 Tax=Pseudolycoriella hygida TaxID=35572 RepID=A0A9Q0MPA2_9DIPT|nr:Primary amine oxidase [Pseudolycoriella hygida]